MATIIEIKTAERRVSSTEKISPRNQALSAEIVIFPGVRYEKMLSGNSCDKTEDHKAKR